MIEIKKLKVNEIFDFITSEEFTRLKNQPVSKFRARSYMNNPRAEDNDVVIYLAYEANELVGYRTILPDFFQTNGKKIKVGWLSGNWVDPKKRRRGIATRLFEQAFADWKGQLIYTNYAPESKAVYDKSGKFEIYKSHHGIRLYFRSSLHVLLKNRVRSARFLLRFIDRTVNIFQNTRLRLVIPSMKRKIPAFEYIQNPGEEIIKKLSAQRNDDWLEERTKKDFEWILNYPWMVESPLKDINNGKYFFTTHVKKKENYFIKISSGSKTVGFVHLLRRDIYMSIPYIYLPENSDIKRQIGYLVALVVMKLKASVLTLYHPEMVEVMKQINLPLLGKRKMIRNYIVSKSLKPKLPPAEDVFFFDGDGDVVFTG